MTKVLGALLLIGGTSVLGFSAADALAGRTEAIRAFLGALEQMERELSFRLTPMPELLEDLAESSQALVRPFFRRCGEELEKRSGRPLSQIWTEGLEDTPLNLKREDKRLLCQLGSVLGRYDGEGQLSALAVTRAGLEAGLKRAEEEQRRLGRIYRALGVTAGVFFTLLLL